ncbi:hypothetical protein A0H81_14005 [Grifola frondosa]|uniref:Uncharacterized protein n=1 Tax=Grifola frondosa TaxID=5627 RepID=A0A1C7LTA8_GRIFR|nr:hypothetical protein A0H81_14005 [Grifola frondosa]
MAKRFKSRVNKSEVELEQKATSNRRKARKKTKAAERTANRTHVAELAAKKYDFLFTWHYQSTDESDSDGAIDPNTDNEAQNEVPLTIGRRRPWVSHAPAYRADNVDHSMLCEGMG